MKKMSRMVTGCMLAAAGVAQADGVGLIKPVEVVELPPMRVAYVEQVGNFHGNGEIYDVLLEKLLAWAIPEKHWNFPEKTQIVNIYPDDPSVPEDQQRLWLGMTLETAAQPPEGIRLLMLPGGRHAVGRFAITSEQFASAWGYMFGEWMAQSAFYPGDGLSFEVQHNDSSEHPEQKHIIDICIPVSPKSHAN